MLSLRGSLESRNARGGTAPVAVRRQLELVGEQWPQATRGWPRPGRTDADRPRPAFLPVRCSKWRRTCSAASSSTKRPRGRSPYGSPKSRRTTAPATGFARVSRSDAAQRDHVRTTRVCVRLLHLRHALVHEPGVRPVRASVGCAAARRRGRVRARAGAVATTGRTVSPRAGTRTGPTDHGARHPGFGWRLQRVRPDVAAAGVGSGAIA